MTDEEKALAKEQAKRWASFLPAEPLPKRGRKPGRSTPRPPRTLPDCVYLGRYFDGGVFYRVVVKRGGDSHHVGCYLSVEEAVRRRDLWKVKWTQQEEQRAGAKQTIP